MRIAVDAMGGDHAPAEVVRGAVDAARSLSGISALVLVGDEQAVRAELQKFGDVPAHINVVHASEVVDMGEPPALAIRRKKDSSISRCVDLVAAGKADAVVSAGNTGAVMVAATLKLRLLKGVERPSIAAVMPTRTHPFVLIDAGANTDCTPSMLAQFAVMGTVYSRAILNIPTPAVGLLSIGGEESKGNETTKKAYDFIQGSDVNFRGNIEGHDLFMGEIDVVVCDGFLGNVVLKTSEGAAHAIVDWMKREFKKNPVRLLGAALLRGAFKTMKKKMDPEVHGGAPLLGVNGVCIITHGSSSHRAISNSIRVASESVHQHLNELLVDAIASLKLEPAS